MSAVTKVSRHASANIVGSGEYPFVRGLDEYLKVVLVDQIMSVMWDVRGAPYPSIHDLTTNSNLLLHNRHPSFKALAVS